MTNLIEGKVVAITGASSVIGQAAARRLAREGAHVVLGALCVEQLGQLAAELAEEGGSARFRPLDVTNRADVQAFVDATVAEFGRIDVMVNNADVEPLSSFDARKVAEWNQMVGVNIRGVLHGIAAALPAMKAQGAGQIVNISSAGDGPASPTPGVYCATQLAVRAISDGLRQEADNIRVTVIRPDSVGVELIEGGLASAERTDLPSLTMVPIAPDVIAQAIAYAIGQPDDVDVSDLVVRPSTH